MAKQYYFIRSKLNGYVLTADANSNNVVNSSRNNPPTSNQLWLIDYQVGGGCFHIISKLNGKVVDTPEGLQAARVILSDRYAGENQRWRRKGLFIISDKNGDALNVCSKVQNAPIITWDKKNVFQASLNQEFDIEKVRIGIT